MDFKCSTPIDQSLMFTLQPLLCCSILRTCINGISQPFLDQDWWKQLQREMFCLFWLTVFCATKRNETEGNETGYLRVRYAKMWKIIFSQWNALFGSSCRSRECEGELLVSSAIIVTLVGTRRILSFSWHSVTKKVLKNGLAEPPFGEYMFIWLVRHSCKRKIQ